jgi:hypothetical protein
MPRRKKTPLVDTSTREILMPDGIPSDLHALGWRYRGGERAERVGPDGEVTAFVEVQPIPQRTGLDTYEGSCAVWGVRLSFPAATCANAATAPSRRCGA